MKKIFVSAGHSAVAYMDKITGKTRDTGASGNGFVEGVEADVFRDLVVQNLEKLGAEVISDPDNTVLADTLKYFKKTSDENSILVEFHFNAATPQATGTETLVPNNPSALEKKIAGEISKSIADTLGIKDRGVKTEAQSARGSLGWMKGLGENILPEICFISNKTDMEKYVQNKEKLAKNIADILYKNAGGVKEELECYYTVVKGDSLSKIAAKYDTTVSEIKAKNKLTTDIIQIGQKLKI